MVEICQIDNFLSFSQFLGHNLNPLSNEKIQK
jgi:hypothetical protein